MPVAPPFKSVEVDAGDGSVRSVSVTWNADLGRLAEGYARGGDHVPGKIRISSGQLRQSRRNAILHELMHEMWSAAGLERWLSQKTEELVVDALSAATLDTLRRNPKLVEFLVGDE